MAVENEHAEHNLSRLSGLLPRLGRFLLGYTAAVVTASVVMVLMWLLRQVLGLLVGWDHVSSYAEALGKSFGVLVIAFFFITVFALPGFLLALLLGRFVRFRSGAGFACLGAVNGALGLALLYAIPDTNDECYRGDAMCPPNFSPLYLLCFMLAGMLAGLAFRKVAIGSRS